MNRIPWWFNRKIAIATITTSIAMITTMVRFMGGFETLELKRYDYFWTKRAIATWDDRIIIVGYTQEDIKQYGESPSDEIIIKVLEKVNSAKPVTVGLFFRREAQPSSLEQRKLLNEQIASMPSLIKSDSNDRIAPETDNIMRKFPFYKRFSDQPHIIWAVSKHYLENTGSSITETKALTNKSITINYPDGKTATIKPLTVLNDGGYSSSVEDLMDFQVLISWPYYRQSFTTYSFDTIINNPPPNFQDKLIIVGDMEPRNIFKAPVYEDNNIYSFLHSSELAGIIISNILQQSDVPFVQVWSDPIEYLYLYGWLIASGAIILWLCEELDPVRKWTKYLLSITITWGVFLLSIYVISLFVFPKLWIPSVFIGRAVTFNIMFGGLVCLEFKLREEQHKRVKKQKKLLHEQQQRIKDKERLEQQQKIEIENLKNTLLAQERLAFIGRLSPFVHHKIKNLYSNFDLNITANRIDINNLEQEFYELLNLLETILDEDEADEKKDRIFRLFETINKRCITETQIFQSVNDLLKRFLPRIRVGETEYLQPQWLNINEVLIESNKIVLFDFKLINQDMVVDVNLDLSENLPAIYGLPSEIRFIFLNIIENAYYALWEKSQTDPNYQPSLTIRSERMTEETIKILIEDNGIGIPANLRKKIFQPFYSTKKSREQTCGIGLTLAKDILEQQYYGTISLEPIEPTCFVIEIPITGNAQ
ncbi:CHASE2 domain-containing protein [Crocosphaera sp.]|uniref:CHASE2 domain-containing protein n=1 Tax=Crocosphaera sp. TaxID=2729996 RepID=UPI003F219411|nr:CHASE2 domain-containing protein [Crocosphaera sp.]